MKRIRCAAPILLLAALAPASARSDAMVRTQAMSATTIAEFFVEDDRVRAELEIGLADLEAFRNLLPDELYEKLGHPRRPWAERVPEFFREDLVLAVEEGAPLPGRVVAIAARPRVRRDEISGEPLPQGEGDVELVVFAELEYALPAKPATLTFSAPSGPKTASVGFVV